jgi:hypothetical protein
MSPEEEDMVVVRETGTTRRVATEDTEVKRSPSMLKKLRRRLLLILKISHL